MSRITIDGSSTWANPYRAKSGRGIDPDFLGHPRISGSTIIDQMVFTSSLKSNYPDGEGVSKGTIQPRMYINNGSTYRQVVDISTIVRPVSRLTVTSGSVKTLPTAFLNLHYGDSQIAYIVSVGGGGGGGRGGGWGVTARSRKGGGAGGGGATFALGSLFLRNSATFNATAGVGGNGASALLGAGSDGTSSSTTVGTGYYLTTPGGSGGRSGDDNSGSGNANNAGGAGGGNATSVNTLMAHTPGGKGGNNTQSGGIIGTLQTTPGTNTLGIYVSKLGSSETFFGSGVFFNVIKWGGSVTGNNDSGRGGGGGASQYSNGGNVTNTFAGAGNLGSGGGGGTSKSGNNAIHGASGGDGRIEIFY